ncbi:CrcB-like protein-domain-containing protein [Xylariomycetidae sp. FL2044]|nr:CrcB-like protein-domain-containing protein [Xylariomycetidae sp. FL2044]
MMAHMTTDLQNDAEGPGSFRKETPGSRRSPDYDIPETYQNLDEVHEPAPLQDRDEEPARSQTSREEDFADRARQGRESLFKTQCDVPDSYMNIPELSDIPPVQDRDKTTMHRSRSLEDERSREQEYRQDQRTRWAGAETEAETNAGPEDTAGKPSDADADLKVSRLATEFYTISYLILFSIFGTLARLGLQALTYYSGAPVSFSVVWPNFAGSLIMGFLAEDRLLFRYEWITPTKFEQKARKAKQLRSDDPEADGGGGSGSGSSPKRMSSASATAKDLAAAKKAHMATKKTLPLYIGLATGFCGSLTSFSSFIRDVFLALSNDLPSPPPDAATTTPRNGGYSFMALVAVVITTISLSISGLYVGAHLALALEPLAPSLPHVVARRALDRLAVPLAWGCWLGAVILSILPPDRFSSPGAAETWRGRVLFALVFAPPGCLVRFYASRYLNGRRASFPLGTFAVNVGGTAVLGMAWDLAHSPASDGGGGGGVIGCQVLQGIEDGFCGCLTTVSTWVAELTALRRRHAYVYGGTSVLVSLAVLVAIMGGLRWSNGFTGLQCLH